VSISNWFIFYCSWVSYKYNKFCFGDIISAKKHSIWLFQWHAQFIQLCLSLYQHRCNSPNQSKHAAVKYNNKIFMKHIHRLVNYCNKWLIKTQPNIFNLWRFGLYQRPSSEEVCLLPLPVLATIVMRRGKKSVVCVAQCVAALVPVHRTCPSFRIHTGFFDPSNIFVRFSVQNCSRWLIDHVVVVRCMVSQSLSVFCSNLSHAASW